MREHRRLPPLPGHEAAGCDVCPKPASYRITITSIVRPAAQRHKHYCSTCWLAIFEHIAKGAANEH